MSVGVPKGIWIFNIIFWYYCLFLEKIIFYAKANTYWQSNRNPFMKCTAKSLLWFTPFFVMNTDCLECLIFIEAVALADYQAPIPPTLACLCHVRPIETYTRFSEALTVAAILQVQSDIFGNN